MSRVRKGKVGVALIVALVAIGFAGISSAMQERFLANAMAMGTVSGTARIEFTIERWTTDEERQQYLAILAEGGQEALVDALHQAGGVGRVRVDTRLSYPISYAYQFEADDGGRRIVLATDRPIGALEAIANVRTMDYTVSIAELRMPPEGNGEGALMVGAQIVVDAANGTITLENFGQAPVRLRNVRRQ